MDIAAARKVDDVVYFSYLLDLAVGKGRLQVVDKYLYARRPLGVVAAHACNTIKIALMVDVEAVGRHHLPVGVVHKMREHVHAYRAACTG